MTMREILFRGKHMSGGVWCEGNLAVRKDGFCIITPDDTPCGVYGQVDPDTVGQFTGLIDKNGTKIFEGDVVKRCFTLTRGPNKESRETQVGVVWYDNVTCGYLIRGACNLRRQWPGDTIEVIGNIHDNPELMEGERHG